MLLQVADHGQLAAVERGVAQPCTPSSVSIFRVTKLRPGQVTMTSAAVIFIAFRSFADEMERSLGRC